MGFFETPAHLETMSPPDGIDETFEEGDKSEGLFAVPDIGDVAVLHWLTS
jgi:hypothetical protein